MDAPLKVKKPNISQIAKLKIPMDENSKMHILDVATALIKMTLGMLIS